MEYGILIAENEDGKYQVICAVDSQADALQFADEYLRLGPDNDYLCPERFVIHRRGQGGAYTVTEPLTDQEWLMKR